MHVNSYLQKNKEPHIKIVYFLSHLTKPYLNNKWKESTFSLQSLPEPVIAA